MTIKKPLETITEETDVYQPYRRKNHLSKMRFKDYYPLFQAKFETEPVQSWSKNYPLPRPFANKWNNLTKSIGCRQTINYDNSLSNYIIGY